MPNPYDPQTPARPEYFGGRQHVLKKLKDRVQMAKEHKKSGGILICGHRGVGKTSLGESIARATGRKYIRAALCRKARKYLCNQRSSI